MTSMQYGQGRALEQAQGAAGSSGSDTAASGAVGRRDRSGAQRPGNADPAEDDEAY